jgi:hypothetical protein
MSNSHKYLKPPSFNDAENHAEGVMSSKTDWQRLEVMDDAAIDTSDIPELDEAFFRNAQLSTPA